MDNQKYVDEIMNHVSDSDLSVEEFEKFLNKHFLQAQLDMLSVDIWNGIISIPWIEGTHRHIDVEKVLEVLQGKINKLKAELGGQDERKEN